MATKKTTKSATKKSTAKPAAKKTSAAKKPVAKKTTTKRVVQEKSILNTDVSILLAMAVESLILLLGYLIIMSVA